MVVLVVLPHELIAIRCGLSADVVRRSLDEQRIWNAPLTIRSSDVVEQRDGMQTSGQADGEEPPALDQDPRMMITGHSAVFDSESELLFGFMRETIKRGAFRRVLKTNPDVRLLVNHEGAPFARTTNGTLTLVEDQRGLLMTAELDDSRGDATDLYHAVMRGDYDQQSFAFTIARDEWTYCNCVTDQGPEYTGCDCPWERSILEIGSLYEVSVVTFPAYPDTTVSVARNSEPVGERAAQACDDEQRDMAPSADPSPSESASDPNERLLLRQWLYAQGVTHHESGNSGGA